VCVCLCKSCPTLFSEVCVCECGEFRESECGFKSCSTLFSKVWCVSAVSLARVCECFQELPNTTF